LLFDEIVMGVDPRLFMLDGGAQIAIPQSTQDGTRFS
jgi:hypothetical protein